MYLYYSLDRGILEDILQETRLLKFEKKVMITNKDVKVGLMQNVDHVMK